MIWAIPLATFAQDVPPLPPRPELLAAVPDECEEPFGAESGEQVDEAPGGLASCAFVGLPVSYHVYLEATAEWSRLCADRYALLDAYGLERRATLVGQRDALAARLVDLERWRRHQWVVRSLLLVAGVSGGVGVGLVIGTVGGR